MDQREEQVNMMKKNILYPIVLSLVLLLTGCASGGGKNAGGSIPYDDQIDLMQRAVDSFQEKSGGLLPIKTRDIETDIYIKYPIDFAMIIPEFTEKIPSNAYEKGGVYQYVLVDVETKPSVKLVDLRIAEKIRELNLRKDVNQGSIPFKDSVGDGVFAIDYKAMGFDKELTVQSPYSETHLPLVVGGNGQFYVDYSIELNRVLKEEKADVSPGEDIRYLLSENSPVLPAYSLPYTVDENNEPVYLNR